MPLYNKVVVAIDPLINQENIIAKAKKIVTSDGSLDMIYVWDEILIAFQGAPLAPPMAYNSESHEQKVKVQETLNKLSKQYAIPKENTHLLTGSVAKEIRKFAKDNKADCIVIGSHGRHGVALLLGSTATSVIHGTPCDILVIKI